MAHSIWIHLFIVFECSMFVCVGFDHQHPEVYEHCKRLLLHLLVVQGTNSSVQSLASVLLRNRELNEPRVLTVKPVLQEFNLTGELKNRLNYRSFVQGARNNNLFVFTQHASFKTVLVRDELNFHCTKQRLRFIVKGELVTRPLL